MEFEVHEEKPDPGRWLRIVNYGMAVLFAVLGILILVGFPIEVEGMMRWILGIVLLLWAIYRAVSTRTKFPIG